MDWQEIWNSLKDQQNREIVSAEGWQWREGENRSEPRLWNDPVWTVPNQPVIGVCWYEAEAYCRWLDEQWHRPPGTFQLPTEAEWEWAARGPEGRRYPWGDGWEAWRCNRSESGLDRTSAVGCFPGGAADWWRILAGDDGRVQDLGLPDKTSKKRSTAGTGPATW